MFLHEATKSSHRKALNRLVDHLRVISAKLRKPLHSAKYSGENERKKLPSIHDLFVNKEKSFRINLKGAVMILRNFTQPNSCQYRPTSIQKLQSSVSGRIKISLLAHLTANNSEVENKNI